MYEFATIGFSQIWRGVHLGGATTTGGTVHPPPLPGSFLLQANSFAILQANGFHIVIVEAIRFLAQGDGSPILQGNGEEILVTSHV